MSICRYDDRRGYLLRSHMPDCKAIDCKGCVPCTHDEFGIPVRHCTAHFGKRKCANHLAPSEHLTCIGCVVRTRGHIEEILTWSVEVMEEALEAGVNSEAANMAGPAADPIRAMWWRVNVGDAAYRAARDAGDDVASAHSAAVKAREALPNEDDLHPLTVLGGYEMRLREDYDEDYSELPPITIPGAATYLLVRLSKIAQDEEQDWPYFAEEVRRCHVHLAEVMHLAQRPEKGAPCPACTKAPALVKHYVEHDHSGASDYWECPSCRTQWTEARYRQRVADDYLENADRLTASQIAHQYEIPGGTLRRWAAKRSEIVNGERVEHPPLLRVAGHSEDGRKLYSVGEVLALRDAKESA